MKTLEIKKIETSILLAICLVLFLSIKAVIPNFLSVFVILLMSFYFFPVKLILNKVKDFNKQNILSDIIISTSLILLIVGIYLDSDFMSIIFTFINFIFLIYIVFNGQNLSEYRKIILNHLLVIFLLQMIQYS
ncbi:hypothetical protein ESY86_17455 [Subsaximicrobium wynnwilliamsii]|uniref:Uncharacterized protein n=1 Tax=Subsaximicrobium wynnwilliamsii TaxID=291179 RepID=A0A5C6ZF23_9FLAO|nr:hypothetical protein [Subsaximicrobium wynnwilliamsii]TXD80826.1 hypothetical protein ESY87_20070 [Subsaximicrobium wynnwilliamsii]TXD87347.1 hypothetical protein ESY86_17455 [Subsaximicrobium wynnwilliamsii]TXE00952.1 hypothetical protein ESY88_17960 [Subsaximicrobium wynnwilliamsii]